MQEMNETSTFHDRATADVMPEEADRLRAGTWNLLGNLLARAPDEAVLELLREVGRDEGIDAGDPVVEAWLGLRRAAEGARPEALAREYQDVFIGLGSGEVIPYASYYRTGALMEQPLIELRRELVSLGIERLDGISEPEDHAAAVCEAMGLAVLDPEVSFEWQKSFCNEHVAPWLGDLFRDIQQAPSADFYRAVGALGEAFMEFERRYFSMLS